MILEIDHQSPVGTVLQWKGSEAIGVVVWDTPNADANDEVEYRQNHIGEKSEHHQ